MSKQAQVWKRAEVIHTGALARIGVCLLVLIYFQVGYKWSFQSHQGLGVMDASTGLDAMIPLVPGFIVFYMLGYLFVLAPCFVVREQRAFRAAMIAFCVCMTTGFLFFHFFPIGMQKTYATGDDWFSRLTYFQQATDTTYNNFPSLHVGLNVYAYALIAWQSSRISRLWLALPVLIIVSTLLVKQHLIVDVAGGLLLAAVGFYLFRWLENSQPAVLNWLYGATLGGLVFVLATHPERIRISWRKLDSFLRAASLDIVPVVVSLGCVVAAGLVFRRLRRRSGQR